MNILILGNGGREHALARKAKKSSLVQEVFVVPGNSGMDDCLIKENSFNSEDFKLLENFCDKNNIELIIVGNEKYLELGVVDYFSNTNIKIFGPTMESAKLETSKDFAKSLMYKYNIPTAKYKTFIDEESALEFLNSENMPVVIKQDGLALGKGVLVSSDYKEAKNFIVESFKTNEKVIFEEFLDGVEFSLLCFVNGDTYIPLQTAKDYKRAFNNDKGLNTGGMGCFTPVDFISEDELSFCYEEIIEKTISALKNENIFFKGIMYAGLIKTNSGIKVIEFNVRFGDPETEVLMEAMETDLVEIILNILKNKKTKMEWKNGSTVGVCLASKGYPQKYNKGFEIKIPDTVDFYSMALKNEQGKFLNDGGRVMFVYASCENRTEARTSVYKKIESIKHDCLFYRTDIGK
ncbi:MAG: phosphoribosylamine--glycine ligase [Lachnospirales bacterium]